jgi:hypothetical protein
LDNRKLTNPEAASDSIDGEYVEQNRGITSLAAMGLTDDAPNATGTSLNLDTMVGVFLRGNSNTARKDSGCLKGVVSTKTSMDSEFSEMRGAA